MEKINKIEDKVVKSVRVIMVFVLISSMVKGIINIFDLEAASISYFITAFTAIITILITYIPQFLVKKDILVIPALIHTFFIIFVFLAEFFGEIGSFYDRFWWWDTMLHFLSGVMFSYVGYLLFYSLNRDSNVRISVNPLFVAIFCFSFSLTCGTLWELFEYAGDSFLGMNMQRWQNDYTSEQWLALQNITNLSNPGLIDTMKDTICNTLGAVLATLSIALLTIRTNVKYVKVDISAEKLAQELEVEIRKAREK